MSAARRAILLDGNSLQVRVHLEGSFIPGMPLDAGLRLAGFLALMEEAGGEAVCLPAGERFTPEGLADAGAAVVLTRSGLPFETGELDALEAFVNRGGGLWILSNHDPYHLENLPLVRRFAMDLEGTFFHTPGERTEIRCDCFDPDHPVILGGAPPETAVTSIVTNTTDSIVPGEAQVVIRLPQGLTDRRESPLPSAGRVFAAVRSWGAGRVLVMADSGMFGSPGADVPGYGLLDRGGNEQFVRNIVSWLLSGD